MYKRQIWDKEWVQGVSGLTDNLFTPDKLEFKKDANTVSYTHLDVYKRQE